MPGFPSDPSRITPDWLSRTLRDKAGNAVTVTDVRVSRIGQDESFMGGRIYRIVLGHASDNGGAPASLIAKFSPLDPAQANAFAWANRREVAFYSGVAQPGLPVPHCHFAGFDPETGYSLILLQDLSAHRAVPFRQGVPAADAGAVMDALAKLHAAYWDSPDLDQVESESLVDNLDFASCWDAYPAIVAELFGDLSVPHSFLLLGDHLVTHRARIFADLLETAPATCLHGDVQADNVLFDAKGQARLFDWQLMGKGAGAVDVAYFLISSLTPETRRAAERDLIARYVAGLSRLGVSGYALENCWKDYRRAVAVKLLVTIAASVRLDNSSAHKRDWRRADLLRLLAFCEDHDITPATFERRSGNYVPGD